MPDFPHMGNVGFPGTDNVNVYAYENVFDYTRWKPDVHVICCNVPWDSDYSNVPNFPDEKTRTAYFNQLPGYAVSRDVETHVLPSGEVKLPLPFGVMSQYNYIHITFPQFTSDESPIAYEQADKRADWYWFITDVEYVAPNTTRCILQLDVWTTFMIDCSITYMMLERGHYPLVQTDADTYLSAPISNTKWLMAPDVNYADGARKCTSIDSYVFNTGSTYAVFCCSGHNESGTNWGTYQDDNVPDNTDFLTACATHYTNQGVPSIETFAVKAADLNDLLAAIDTQCPQFKQTVQCIFFASTRMVDIGSSWTFCGCTVYTISSSRSANTLLSLTKDSFGYGSSYEDLAKLYTYPYSHIEIATESGPVAEIRIEDLQASTVRVTSVLSFAWPAIKLDANILGVNGAVHELSFTNLTERNFSYGGDWFKRLVSWDVPVFGVVQSGKLAYDVSTYFDREQAAADRDNTRTNARLKNDLEYGDVETSDGHHFGNVKRMNDREQDNAFNMAEANYYNAGQNVTYLNAMNASGGYQHDYYNDSNDRTNTFVARQATLSNNKASSDVNTTVNLNAAMAALENEALAATSVIGGTSSNIGGIAGGAVAGAIAGGPAGALVGSAAGAVSGIVSLASAAASLPVVAGKNAGVSSLASTAAQAMEGHVETYNSSMSTATQNYNDDMNSYRNTLIRNQNTAQVSMLNNQRSKMYGAYADTRADSGTVKWNAAKTKEVKDNIATYTHEVNGTVISNDAENANSRIRNARRQGRVNAPRIYGKFDPQHATTRPIALFAEVVTQPTGAIQAAGDQFLRYGYMCNSTVNASALSLMSNFTYWKAEDLWIVSKATEGKGGNGVPEKAIERIKKIFEDGVTVWETPNLIGAVSIYDNEPLEGTVL